MFTESKILDLLGAGEETITHITGLCSSTSAVTKGGSDCKFLSNYQVRLGKEGHISWNEEIKLQEIFDAIHPNIFPSFTIQELTIVRGDSVVTTYNLPERISKTFCYKTFGFKPGTFKRFGADVSPGKVLYGIIMNRKNKLSTIVPKTVLRRLKDCVLMNFSEYTIDEIRKQFLDVPYIMRIEERNGIFYLNDFVDAV